MIKRLEIYNFRSHENTVLDFHDRVNVIVGRGQAGKTNIKRAIEWLKDNRPLGTKYISWFAGSDPCQVVLHVANPDADYRIIASRSKTSKMEYDVLNLATMHEQHFDTVSTGVPDVVTALLNMSDINIQDQLSAPYLVAGSTGDISKAVNRVIDAQIADDWLTELESRRRATGANIKAKEDIIKTGEARLKELEPVDAAGELIMSADRIDTQIITRQNQATNLIGNINNAQKAEGEINRINYILAPATQLLELVRAVQATIDTNTARAAAINAALNAQNAVDYAMQEYLMAKAQYIQHITALGQCPTCYGPADEQTIKRLEETL